MAANRTATATWNGDLKSGRGRVGGRSSGAFSDLSMSWRSRAEAADGATSPEELIAAAHAGCFSMALANELAAKGHTPSVLEVACTVTFDPAALRITRSVLDVSGDVPGIDEASFRQAAEAAKEGCPVSRALSQDVAVELRANLTQAGERSIPPSIH